MTDLVFDENQAQAYEAWFDTVEGRRADALEKQLLARLLAGFGEPGTLLEVGCGTGHFNRWFTEGGWQAAGVDISAPMLHEARRRERAVHVALAAGEALPFGTTAYDVVALITVLEFTADPVRVVREALRVARRGLLVGALNRWSLLAVDRRLRSWFAPSPYGAAHFLSPGELHRIVRQAAGSSWPLRLETRTTLWPRLGPFVESGLPWGAFLAASVVKREDGE